MKTPEEIKKALSCSLYNECMMDECPYYDTWPYDEAGGCFLQRGRDTLEYIQQLENHIGELTEKVAQFESNQPKWVSVEDNLPDDFKDVLVYCIFHESNWVEVAHQFRGNWWKGGKSMLNVSYWMPLPASPNEVEP